MLISFLRRFASLLLGLLAIVASLSGCDCGKKACSSDAICSKGEICLLDVCLTGCRESTDCEGGKFCVEYRCVTEECKAGIGRSCFSGPADTLGIGFCQGGIQFCQADGRWSKCSGEILPQAEICDGLDNDCNGQIDDLADGKKCSCPTPGTKRECFPGNTSLVGRGICRAGLQYCEDNNAWGLCLGFVPPAPEICDGKDNDCNGLIDEQIPCGCKEGDTRSCYSGASGTLDVGICKRGVQTCRSKMWSLCEGEQTPKAEICGDSKDNDCNGLQGDSNQGTPCTKEPTKEPTIEPAREAPDTKAEPVFDAGPDAKPDAAPDTRPVPDAAPDTSPDVPAPDKAPDAAPDTRSEPAPSEMVPDAGPDMTPDSPTDASPEPPDSAGEPPLESLPDDGGVGPDEPQYGPDEPQYGPDEPLSNPDMPVDDIPEGEMSTPEHNNGGDMPPDLGGTGACQTNGAMRACSQTILWQTQPGQFSCQQQNQTCSNGVWSSCVPFAKTLSSSDKELCNGRDDDCNGLIDEGLSVCNPATSPCAGESPCAATLAGPRHLKQLFSTAF